MTQRCREAQRERSRIAPHFSLRTFATPRLCVKQGSFTKSFLLLAIGMGLLLACSAATPALSTPRPPAPLPAAPAAAALVIDHTTTDLNRIPPEWLAQAKTLAIHFAHTSHGSQLITGAEWWEMQRPELDIDVRYEVEPPGPNDALNIYDGNDYDGDNYITPEMYWASEDGRTHTDQVANSGYFGYSMWSWCGQQSDNSVGDVNTYLDTLAQFETDHPGMRFIYMTGHTDGGGATLARNNQMVREYAAAHNKVLFDFADIEQYDPAGNYYPDADDSCPWCPQWCADHPEECADLPEWGDWCAHTHPLQCRLKGQAFWWMMARLAGWPGPDDVTAMTFLPVVSR